MKVNEKYIKYTFIIVSLLLSFAVLVYTWFNKETATLVGTITSVTAAVFAWYYGVKIALVIPFISYIFYVFYLKFLFNLNFTAALIGGPVKGLIPGHIVQLLFIFIIAKLNEIKKNLKEEIKKKKYYEEKLLNARNKAIKARKAEEDFISKMSHEIRTPLTGIIGILNIFSDNLKKPENKKYLRLAQISGYHLVNVINEVLDISKIQSGKNKINTIEFSLRKLISEIFDISKPQTEIKGLKLEISIDKNIPDIYNSDSGKIRQILINLIGNAIKYTEKGKILISIERSKNPDKNIEYILFNISDTGAGIHPEEQKKIFQKYTQLPVTNKAFSTGLGLLIARQLTELLNGKIKVTSPGRFYQKDKIIGADFQVILPMISLNKKTHQQKKAISPKKIPDFKNTLILLAEDNEINQIIISKILQKTRCHIDIALNGKEAVSIIKKKKYDIVLMDLHMPEMDGYEASVKIKEINKNIPIIALTADILFDKTQKIKKSAFDSVLYKPFQEDKIFETIQRFNKK